MTHKQHCLSSLTKNGNLNSVENSNILTISSLSSTVDHAVLTIKVSKYKNQHGGQGRFCSAAKAQRETVQVQERIKIGSHLIHH